MSEHELNGTAESKTADGWTAPVPQEIPPPSYSPAMLAMGITLALWGIVTAWPVWTVGLALTLLSLRRWLGELIHGE
jgi:hypothetical protein